MRRFRTECRRRPAQRCVCRRRDAAVPRGCAAVAGGKGGALRRLTPTSQTAAPTPRRCAAATGRRYEAVECTATGLRELWDGHLRPADRAQNVRPISHVEGPTKDYSRISGIAEVKHPPAPPSSILDATASPDRSSFPRLHSALDRSPDRLPWLQDRLPLRRSDLTHRVLPVRA